MKLNKYVFKKNSFFVDWKFSAEDLIYSVEQIVGKLPIKYLGYIELYGYAVDVLEVDNTPIVFKSDNSVESLNEIIDFINKHLPDQSLQFEHYDTGGDSYGFRLVKK